MTQEERVNKYLNFANRILSAAKESSLSNAVDVCKSNRIDTHFFAELVKKGYFYRLRKSGWQTRYTSDRTDPFTFQEIESILNDMTLQVKMRGVNKTPREQKEAPPKDLAPILTRLLSEYTPRELIDELKRRGYSGKLLFTKEIKF